MRGLDACLYSVEEETPEGLAAELSGYGVRYNRVHGKLNEEALELVQKARWTIYVLDTTSPDTIIESLANFADFAKIDNKALMIYGCDVPQSLLMQVIFERWEQRKAEQLLKLVNERCHYTGNPTGVAEVLLYTA